METTAQEPKHVISIDVMYFDSRLKQYVLHVDDTEISNSAGCEARSVMVDFAHKTNLLIEETKRFSEKRLKELAANWKNVSGLRELIAEICKVRGLELTEASKKILEA